VGGALPADGGDAEAMLAKFAAAGMDVTALAAELQRDGARAFEISWCGLMDCIASKAPG